MQMHKNVARAAWALAAVLVALAIACGAKGKSGEAPRTPYAPEITPSNFTDQVTNRYFPLLAGTTFVYEGTKDGVAVHNEVTVTHDSKTILGVRCVVVHDVVVEDGELREETFDWYAQDSAGNVWYFGEDSKEYDGTDVRTKGSWEAGVDGALPGIVMEAAPSLGETYRQEYYAGEAEDMARVLSVSETANVPNGSYQGVLVTEDFTPLEPDMVEHKYFAPGVGFVKSSMTKGGSEELALVSVRME